MNHAHSFDHVLAVHPTARGVTYVLFEGPLAPVDWEIKNVRGPRKNPRCLAFVSKVIERFQPDVLVIEDYRGKDSRRSERIQRLYRAIETAAHAQTVDIYRYTRPQIRACFSGAGAVTKQEIAIAIAKHIPAFEHRLPPVRKPWMSEDIRMALFDAASLAMTFYSQVDGDSHRGVE